MPPHDSYWVIPDKLLAGPYPGAPDDAEAVAKLEDFVATGVRSFVDLTEEGEESWKGPLRPYEHLLAEVAERCGVQVSYARMPIRDTAVPAEARMREIAGLIRRESETGAVYVHCWGGVGRTGTVIACMLIEHGSDAGAALARLSELRRQTKRADRDSPENPEQCQFVRSWAPGRAAPDRSADAERDAAQPE